jgi:hypothetical protein
MIGDTIDMRPRDGAPPPPPTLLHPEMIELMIVRWNGPSPQHDPPLESVSGDGDAPPTPGARNLRDAPYQNRATDDAHSATEAGRAKSPASSRRAAERSEPRGAAVGRNTSRHTTTASQAVVRRATWTSEGGGTDPARRWGGRGGKDGEFCTGGSGGAREAKGARGERAREEESMGGSERKKRGERSKRRKNKVSEERGRWGRRRRFRARAIDNDKPEHVNK